MARSQEKAHSMLNRWKLMQNDQEIGNLQIKPKHPDQCKTIQAAKYWRQMIIKEMGQKVSEIQNGTLGENAVRALNNEINNLNKERIQYERKIKQLGGVSFGKKTKESDEFTFFGAAQYLPEAKELQKRNNRKLMSKQDIQLLGEEYYGMDDYETTDLLEEELSIQNELKQTLQSNQ
ncbi:cell cycle control protein, putative [Entamoeba histolytica HM-1:IMSS-B]|uniref:Cell cycle control protein cwf12, putative n=6 Tax=Entamoeba histolytica TaxID=5759 RepID=C4LVU3_ENTH1|nr:cell cycle control protein cwf12, putative [Entamoeba histolytica HM-1:IMSS]EMD47824.1 cell cycle control protein cwf12, putative [Entamoeba histolytica KU27]EMH76912.1 cell cycle control protein, putative [Entamoeba histolytica HM-1:IMSS-B]EMS13383.1 cell cycle control protein cwf12, putative [Entamoeba histolytica HM-3:IMSS]ENY59936.1 cell cycle control protein cwf12, putative [Entamoeba histolytica HM-1:IMSS-A]GAT92799.1 cell cycle control protein cwf12 putative [Entamoeba histolytica]|eukprot:XP_656460.1 cell cycle control protein cwf12, putative [Entamoeba histolytica HM-1:IMSS]